MINTTPFIGKRFEYLGRGPSTYDCFGLVIAVYAMEGIEIPDYEYPEEGHAGIIENFHRHWTKVQHPSELDIALFNMKAECDHMGVCLQNGKFIHAPMNSTVKIEKLCRYKSRLYGYFEYKS